MQIHEKVISDYTFKAKENTYEDTSIWKYLTHILFKCNCIPDADISHMLVIREWVVHRLFLIGFQYNHSSPDSEMTSESLTVVMD